ncbi:MAG: hypothetical protein OXF02_00305 [Simkaniaceae bacterium]|nr:hypothetical protein [Simkaniaceae bacterium]
MKKVHPNNQNYARPDMRERSDHTLSSEFAKKGEAHLLRGDPVGFHLLSVAVRLNPDDFALFHNQGLALLEYGIRQDDLKILFRAGKSFKEAVRLEPDYLDAWHMWGYTLYVIGTRRNEPLHIRGAIEKYETAILIAEKWAPDSHSGNLLADLYRELGNAWVRLARSSQEAQDLRIASEAYECASSHGAATPDFFLRFGNAYVLFGQKVNNPSLISKGIAKQVRATFSRPRSGYYRLQLGIAYKALYEYTYEEEHFTLANDAFVAAASLSSEGSFLRKQWAELLLAGGLFTRDVCKLRACVARCRRGLMCRGRKDARLSGIMSVALVAIGQLKDDVRLLRQGEKEVRRLLSAHRTDPHLYGLYGECLMLRGEYFHDSDSYYLAIEYFQEALSLDSSLHACWFGMGRAYLETGLMHSDAKDLAKSRRFFARALGYKVTGNYLYYHGRSLLESELFAGEEGSSDNTARDHDMTDEAARRFEVAFALQPSMEREHPETILDYAEALVILGDKRDDGTFYLRAIDLLLRTLVSCPELPEVHDKLAIAYGWYASLTHDVEAYRHALKHFRAAHKRDPENDQTILDWGITLIDFAGCLLETSESHEHYVSGELKLVQAARLGNPRAFFLLACFYAMIGNRQSAIRFLLKAKKLDALPPLHVLLENEWLQSIKNTDMFREFVEAVNNTRTE